MLPHFEYAIALTCHANAALRGIRGSEPLWRNFMFRNQHWILFAEGWGDKRKHEKQNVEQLLFPTAEAWFDDLVARQAKRVRIWRLPTAYETSDRISAASLGGGGEWIMEAMFPDGESELWCGGKEAPPAIRPEREPGRLAAHRRRTFRNAIKACIPFADAERHIGKDCLTYWRYNRLPSAANEPSAPLEDAWARFHLALTGIRDFAVKHRPDYIETFERAMACLASAAPESNEFSPRRPVYAYAPDGALPLPARQVLYAASAAWVFGGMMSWNDYWAESEGEDREYKRVSDEMYDALCGAAVAAANQVPGE